MAEGVEKIAVPIIRFVLVSQHGVLHQICGIVADLHEKNRRHKPEVPAGKRLVGRIVIVAVGREQNFVLIVAQGRIPSGKRLHHQLGGLSVNWIVTKFG
jgi:hypothetical protein